MIKEITLIGGAGHVGLAFGLICAQHNIKIHLHDINSDSLNSIKNGKMPHKEKGGEKILKLALKKKLITFSNNLQDLKLNKINIICIGTPVDEFLNSDHGIIIKHLNDIKKYIKNNQHIIIRSTVSPGTTEFVFNFFSTSASSLLVKYE